MSETGDLLRQLFYARRERDTLLDRVREAEAEITRLTVVGEPHRRSRRRWNAIEADRDAALAKLSEVEAERDELKRMLLECHPTHLNM